MPLIESADLAPFADIPAAKLEAMIADAVALAIQIAPCLEGEDELTPQKRAAAKAILRAALLRWHDSGSGALQQNVAGPFSVSYVQQDRRSMFWPSEITKLQEICQSEDDGTEGAFSIDTAPGAGTAHLPWCALSMGASWCSCGADIAGMPIYELGDARSEA